MSFSITSSSLYSPAPYTTLILFRRTPRRGPPVPVHRLGIIYVLAVGALELCIMPRYVYGPLRLMLDADEAARQGHRAGELIEETQIPGDEIGQIMRSRNETLALLRHHEAELVALYQDLQQKNLLLETEAQHRRPGPPGQLGMLSASVAHELNMPLSVRGPSKLIETVQDRLQDHRAHASRRRTPAAWAQAGHLPVRRPEPDLVHSTPHRGSWSLVAIDEKAARVHFNNSPAPMVLGWQPGPPHATLRQFSATRCGTTGGNITVSCHLDTPSWIHVLVDDDGPGIPAHVLPNIFEAFVTTRLDARGTGLGLTVAEGIAHQHGGSISAANRPGGGARLEVRLPAPSQSGPSQ